MLKKRLLPLGAIVITAGLFLGGCSNKITEEQLAQLKELRKQDKSLTEMLNKKKDEKKKLQNEINARTTELNDCAKKRDYIKSKLSQWPNVWPDKPTYDESK